MIKCSHPDCARDAVKSYCGRKGVKGRPPAGTEGIPVCLGHYEQLRRGQTMTRLRTGNGIARREAIEDCAVIAEFHGAFELAALFRRLRT